MRSSEVGNGTVNADDIEKFISCCKYILLALRFLMLLVASYIEGTRYCVIRNLGFEADKKEAFWCS